METYDPPLCKCTPSLYKNDVHCLSEIGLQDWHSLEAIIFFSGGNHEQ